MKKIEEQELKELQELNTEFNKLKTNLGDLALQKHGICLKVEEIKKDFQSIEMKLMKKYGEDSIINLETGEVKPKEKEEKE
jgi:hypothetical protein|tara:strand:- start:542 stop:784 length:243 start_codon:yes stop_codon:yes gene_type:complete